MDDKPLVSKEIFWQEQLKDADRTYTNYRYPHDLYSEFTRIRDYLQLNGGELVFVIPPIHDDLQKKASEYRLDNEIDEYKRELHTLGIVYEFDTDEEFNRNKELYKDPFHADDALKSLVIQRVWGHHLEK